MTADSYIGKRLSFNSHLCTVRYIGQVRGTWGDWLGVEWDDPGRGKHSGEYNGTRYFECLSGEPTAGSFVRPNRPSDPSRNFLDALRYKYASDNPDDGTSVHGHSEAKIITFGTKAAEEIGFDKIRKQLADFHELKVVILDGLGVSQLSRRREDGGAVVEGAARVRETCPKILELELSRNLFEDWAEVTSVCEELDRLRSLRIDGTRFRDINLATADHRASKPVYEGLRSLSIQYGLLTWQQIASIASSFVRLQHLLCGGNRLRELSHATLPDSLTVVSLEEGLLQNLDDARPLSRLPHLQKLVLKRNRIASIDVEAVDEKSPLVFQPSLTDVDLSYNLISSWDFINALQAVFPGLISLRVAHNPLYDDLRSADGKILNADDGYMLTIARLAPLESLNFSTISAKERLNAESYYLSSIARELSKNPESAEPAILRGHPRYAALCGEYGEPNVDRAIEAVNPNSLAARLVRFQFYLAGKALDGVKGGGLSKAEIEIPKRYSVYAVMGIVGKKFNLEPVRLRLIWETGEYEVKGQDKAEGEESDMVSDDELSEDERSREIGEREVELVPSSRPATTWIDGHVAKVRVELKRR
ncbi:tubulin-specific chaperone E [Eremomyces bilateralis CBS 781.70]|uniref:Tubulin-specific chaperone E n=1 Tax=Eremomyces bilateralis CBS 781.70 TaxID=1392243 RepID=A0A6G1GG10_9PEZI|nr:tubulin-specific chaperone E [Eremomyces bilateralis CBS 781.70]KAF1816993.1 tubulin-specific chaperone E [Eremomyces bilateralis CBS 781.70]